MNGVHKKWTHSLVLSLTPTKTSSSLRSRLLNSYDLICVCYFIVWTLVPESWPSGCNVSSLSCKLVIHQKVISTGGFYIVNCFDAVGLVRLCI